MYDFVVGEYVRRRHYMWSWDRIRTHRQFFHEYKRLWVTKLTSLQMTMSAQDQLDIKVLLAPTSTSQLEMAPFFADPIQSIN